MEDIIPNTIFISYNRKDSKWVDRLRVLLKPLTLNYGVSLWDDSSILPDAEWMAGTLAILRSAKAAILLVSDDYLASEYIRMTEVPELLDAARTRGLIILWIAIGPSSFMETEISRFTALNDPSRPLASLSRPDQEKELAEICSRIAEVLRAETVSDLRAEIDSETAREPQVKAEAKTGPGNEPAGTAASGSVPGSASPEAAKILKQGLGAGASDKNALNDKPLDDVKKDTLGFDVYVYALRDFIKSQETTTPLTISVNGAWGSGKSSLMRMLQKELEPGRPRWLLLIKLRWLARWLSGSFFFLLGRSWAILNRRARPYVKLGLAFNPAVEVSEQSFNEVFKQYVQASVERDYSGDEPERVRDERLRKARFWARKAMLRQKMEPYAHPTVWFNAWKFNEQEQLWSALALAVLDQLKRKYGFVSRVMLLARLTLKRLYKLEVIRHVGIKLLVPLALAALAALYQIYKEQLKQVIPAVPEIEGGWVWLAPVLAAVWQAWKEIENPFELPIEKILDKPDYKKKVGFIGTFEEDFSRIVEVAVRRAFFWKPRKLVIFIDDLDRCSPLQAAGIIEAINLFLDSTGCVFILGMDMHVVATSIEFKYDKLSERMRQETPGLLSPGSLFLDKIVQIPLNVPRPNSGSIGDLMKSMTEPKPWVIPPLKWPGTWVGSLSSGTHPAAESVPKLAPLARQEPGRESGVQAHSSLDRASFMREDIRQAIIYTSRLLKEYPRQLKRFVNLFRLQVYIADKRHLVSDDGLHPVALAVWVAWYMQWPELVKLLSSPDEGLALSKWLTFVSQRLHFTGPPEEQTALWVAGTPPTGLAEAMEADGPSHWAKLPWQFWIKDGDFLHCIKYLERYWAEPALLKSLLDMTHITAKDSDAALAAAK